MKAASAFKSNNSKPMSLHPESKILIVGSGVFGLSTALWLARSGYRRVTVFDMQDTGSAGYDPGAGIKSASADSQFSPNLLSSLVMRNPQREEKRGQNHLSQTVSVVLILTLYVGSQ